MADISIGNVSFIGPFAPKHKISLDGFEIPNITATPLDSGNVFLSLDDRFGIEGTAEECAKWLWFVANAMAIGAGYSCFGENSVKDPNPFKVGMRGVSLPPRLEIVKKD